MVEHNRESPRPVAEKTHIMNESTAVPLIGRLVLSVATLVTLACSPVWSADEYSQGCQSYTKGDYQTALALFTKAVAKDPGNPLAHYALANTYAQLHRRIEAKKEYSECLSHDPDSKTAESCRKMIRSLGGDAAAATATDQQGKSGDSGSRWGGSAINSAEAKKAQDLERKKQEIIGAAEKEASAIRAEARRKIEALKEQSTFWTRDEETGKLVPVPLARRIRGARTEVEDQSRQILEEADARAQKIMEQATDRANHL